MTPIDPTLIETLLNISEGETLDFKRDQYPFSGASEEQKGELVKDVLAFANAWKTTDAFIVIGANENPGARAKVVGVTSHLNDADLQQLVNAKTNRPVHFEYVPVTVDGIQLGVVRVKAEQQRPIFLVKPFGKLKASAVYTRRGSSTAEAGPDEIARMGASAVSSAQEPSLSVELGDPEQRRGMGTSVVLTSRLLYAPHDPAFLLATLPMSSAITSRLEMNEGSRYRRDVALLNRVGFCVANLGRVLVEDVRLVMKVERLPCLRLHDELPEEPYTRGLQVGPIRRLNLGRPARSTRVREAEDMWEVVALVGKVQPDSTAWSRPFWIGSTEECSLQVAVRIHGDNLGKAIDVPLTINIDVVEGAVEEPEADDGAEVE